MEIERTDSSWPRAFIPLALVLLGFFYGLLLRFEVVPLKREAPGSIGIQDYAFQAVQFREFCAGRSTSPYLLSSQKTAIDAEYAQDFKSWMPAGISPAWILPICGLSYFSGAITSSAALWCFASLAALALALAAAMRKFARIEDGLMLLLTVLISESMLRSVSLGQTSILAAAGLLWFASTEDRKFPWLDAAFAMAAALKPTYFAIFAISVVGLRGVRSAISALAAPIFLGALALCVYGPGIWTDYLAGISGFAGEMPVEYKPSFALDAFVTIRSAAAPIIGPDSALFLSKILSAASFSAAALWAFNSARTRKFSPGAGVAASFALLLFAPYAGAYEDILFLFPVCALLACRELLKTERIFLALSILCVLNFAAFPPGLIWAAFFVKLICASLILIKISGAARRSS